MQMRCSANIQSPRIRSLGGWQCFCPGCSQVQTCHIPSHERSQTISIGPHQGNQAQAVEDYGQLLRSTKSRLYQDYNVLPVLRTLQIKAASQSESWLRWLGHTLRHTILAGFLRSVWSLSAGYAFPIDSFLGYCDCSRRDEESLT